MVLATNLCRRNFLYRLPYKISQRRQFVKVELESVLLRVYQGLLCGSHRKLLVSYNTLSSDFSEFVNNLKCECHGVVALSVRLCYRQRRQVSQSLIESRQCGLTSFRNLYENLRHRA